MTDRADERAVLLRVELAELEASGCFAGEAAGEEVIVVRSRAGIRAYRGVCPHLGGPLGRGRFRDDRIRCPWHRYEYDAAGGQCLTVPGGPWRGLPGREASGPARLRLVPLEVEVDDSQVAVFRRGA